MIFSQTREVGDVDFHFKVGSSVTVSIRIGLENGYAFTSCGVL